MNELSSTRVDSIDDCRSGAKLLWSRLQKNCGWLNIFACGDFAHYYPIIEAGRAEGGMQYGSLNGPGGQPLTMDSDL